MLEGETIGKWEIKLIIERKRKQRRIKKLNIFEELRIDKEHVDDENENFIRKKFECYCCCYGYF